MPTLRVATEGVSRAGFELSAISGSIGAVRVQATGGAEGTPAAGALDAAAARWAAVIPQYGAAVADLAAAVQAAAACYQAADVLPEPGGAQ